MNNPNLIDGEKLLNFLNNNFEQTSKIKSIKCYVKAEIEKNTKCTTILHSDYGSFTLKT